MADAESFYRQLGLNVGKDPMTMWGLNSCSIETPSDKEILRRLNEYQRREKELLEREAAVREREMALREREVEARMQELLKREEALREREASLREREMARLTEPVAVDEETLKEIVLGEQENDGFFTRARKFLARVFGRKLVEKRECLFAEVPPVASDARRVRPTKARPTHWSLPEAQQVKITATGERMVALAEGA
jgi:hypothetical protein